MFGKLHRSLSDKLDRAFKGNRGYERFDRPLNHGTYHAGRYLGNGKTPEEWARAKDQYSKFGTGQQHTDLVIIIIIKLIAAFKIELTIFYSKENCFLINKKRRPKIK